MGQLAPILGSILCLLLLAAGTARGESRCSSLDPEVLALLDAVATRGHAVGYDGVITFRRGENTSSIAVHQDVQDGLVYGAMTLGDEGRRSIVDRQHPLQCEHPGHRLLLAAVSAATDCELAAHYRLQTTGRVSVAGREAVRLLIQPRDLYRHGYVLLVDPDSALILGATVFGAGGRPLETFEFDDIELEEIGTHVIEPLTSASDSRAPVSNPPGNPPDNGSGLAGSAGFAWNPGWLPGGFVSTDSSGMSDTRHTFSDGMAAFSVFVEPRPPSLQPGEGLVRQGSTVVYTRGLQLGSEAVLVTVLGEIPVNTARMVADSVSRVR